jgi:hypothetical protein
MKALEILVASGGLLFLAWALGALWDWIKYGGGKWV